MKKMFLKCAAALFLAPCLLAGADLTLNGAGASFPAPVYRLWTYNYTQQNNGAAAVARNEDAITNRSGGIACISRERQAVYCFHGNARTGPAYCCFAVAA